MKRQRQDAEDQVLNDLVNSPRKERSPEEKALTGHRAPKFALLFNQSNYEESIAKCLKWKRQWNAFLVFYLNSLLHNENNNYLSIRLEQLRKARRALTYQSLDSIKKSADQESLSIALEQFDSFTHNLSLEKNEVGEIPLVLKSISTYDKFILGNYEILKLTLLQSQRVIEDLSANPTYVEYAEMLQDLEDVIRAFNDHMSNLSKYPSVIERKVSGLKSTSLKPYFSALLQERKQKFLEQLEVLEARLTMIVIYHDEIEAEMQQVRETANTMVEIADESFPTNGAPGNF